MKLIQRLFLILTFIVILTLIIGYARGYRLDFQKKSFTPTGILAISSSPKAAKVYINGVLRGATDLNIALSPGRYQVEIKKDGYTSLTKTIALKGELVESVDALLFPTNPSLSPLTNLGIVKAIKVGQTDKILLFSQSDPPAVAEDKSGIYIFDPGKKALSFLPPLKLLILKKNLPTAADLTRNEVYFSPDLKQAIFDFPRLPASSFLLSLEEQDPQPFDVTTSKETLLSAWEEEKQKEIEKVLETYPKDIKKVASDSFHIISFSPDETKIFYQAGRSSTIPAVIKPPLIATNQTKEQRSIRKDDLYVYDKKEDKNFPILNSMMWYSDSKHLVLNEGKKISIIDYDGTNKQTVYSGPFDGSFFSITADGKIVVLANLNPETNKLPDLYLVGIR